MADALDVLSLAEGKAAINAKSTNFQHDKELAQHITAVSRLIDDRCGPVVQREIEAEIHSGGGCNVFLQNWPVVEVTLVREASPGSILTVDPVGFGEATEGYQLDPATGQLTRVGGDYGFVWAQGGRTVEVTYTAGRYEDTESVDARFKDCAGSILRRLWKREAGTWAQSADFYESTDDTTGTGFYRVADPIIREMLGGDRQRDA